MLKVSVYKLNLFVAPLCSAKCTTAFSQYQTDRVPYLSGPLFLGALFVFGGKESHHVSCCLGGIGEGHQELLLQQ